MYRSKPDRILPEAFRAELSRIIGPHNRKAHDRHGGIKRDCATATREDREAILKLAFADLATLGYKLQTPRSLREKHLTALAAHWKDKGLAVQTLHKRFSILRVFAGWIGKQGLVGELEQYFGESLKRSSVATENKGWVAHGVDPEELIARATKIDERFGLYLALQHRFGVRVKESIQLRPLHSSFEERGALEVFEGTKGGRPRLVPIETEAQREVLEWAKRVATASRNGRIRWLDCSWKQAQRRFYHLMEKVGATRSALGVTAHGLRHDEAQRHYRKHAGQAAPVDGGDPRTVDPATHKVAMMKASWVLGHGRPAVTTYYVGSFGHAQRGMSLDGGLSPQVVSALSNMNAGSIAASVGV